MKIEKQESGKAIILVPKGDLVYEGIDELENYFKILSDDASYVILDLTYTKYISAKALGIIVYYVKHFREKQRDLKLINVNENIKKLLHITDIIKIVSIFENEGAALASIGPQVGKLEKMLLWSKERFV